MSLAIWEYFWAEADWGGPPAPTGQVPAASRYVYRNRVNYVTRAAIFLSTKLKELLAPRLTPTLQRLRFIRART